MKRVLTIMLRASCKVIRFFFSKYLLLFFFFDLYMKWKNGKYTHDINTAYMHRNVCVCVCDL